MKSRLLVLSWLLLSSCSIRYVHMKAMSPALITVPQEVNQIVLLDRSQAESKEKNILGEILSANVPGDREAAIQELFNGLQSQLTYSGRFTVVKATEVFPGNNVSSTFPNPLPWQEISHLCEKYDAQAVIALEIFSTKFIVTNGSRMVTREVQGVNIPVPQIYAKGVASADIGIRFYDPTLEQVVDEKLFSQSGDWEANGTSITDAVKLLIDKTEATRQISYDAGVLYGKRISPSPVTITREFFQKPKRNEALARGRRQADARLWKEAAETWEAGIATARRKAAGRLAYNTAIAHEVLGHFELAIKWAQTAYVDYGNKKAKEYSDLLHYRLRQENILEDQR